MEITVPISSNIALRIENRSKGGRDYPSSRLQKGFVLEYDGQELVDEAVGFGVPVLKLGHNTIFAGDLDLSSQHYGRNQIITALYHMNLEERINRPKTGSIENKQLYTIKNSLAWLIRTYPLLRGLLTAVSNGLRHMFKWQTVYEQVKSYGEVKVTYSVDTAVRKVFMIFDMIGLQTNGIAEVAVMNEQGAHYFTHYQDSEGLDLREKEIGCWDEVIADQASFICDQYRLAFHLRQIDGVRLFRGRELIGKRLAWSGFGYTFASSIERFQCSLRIEQML